MKKDIVFNASDVYKTTKDFEIYSNGLCNCSVCTNIHNIEQLTKLVNEENPTGIRGKWELSTTKFQTGEENPCPCEQNPKTHKHYLFVC